MLRIRISFLFAVLLLLSLFLGFLLLPASKAAPDVYNPSGYNLLGSTAYVSGSLSDLQSDNSVYMTYRSYPTAFSTTTYTQAFVGYRSNTGTNLLNSPKARGWNGATWDASETELPTAGSSVRSVRVAYSTLPQYYDYKIAVALCSDGTLDAYAYNGTSWKATNNLADLWTTAPTGSQRPYDIAFETSSGNALLVYGWFDDTTNDLAYRRWFAGNQSWSGQVLLDDPTEATEVDYSFIALDNDKTSGSNYVGLIALVTTSSDSLAGVWNGSTWASLLDLSTSVSITSEEDIGVVWAYDGSLMVVSGEGANEVVRWRRWTKTTGWGTSSTFDMDSFTAVATNWITIKADPATDDLMLTMIDAGSDLNTGYWNGATWSITSNIDTSVDTNAQRCADFEWEPSGSRGLLVRGTTLGVITWRTWTTGVGWGTTNNPVMGVNTHPWVQLRRNPRNVAGDTKILGAVLESTANDLGAIKWDGTTFTVIGSSTLSADTTVSTYECFDLEFQNFGDPTSFSTEVEFTGSSNPQSWTKLTWTTNTAWAVPSVNTTVQLYNYQLGQYPTSGDGYVSYFSHVIANNDETKNQTIISNPTSFRDTTGNWKLKITGVKATSTRFNVKVDLVSFETSIADVTPPAWSNAGTNNTIAEQPTRFYVRWTDNSGLSGFIFGTNNTGTWSNDTWVSMSGTTSWSNITKTLNSAGGKIVQWRVWTNDASNNWADTGIQSLTTKQLPVASFTYSPTTPYTSDTVTFNASASYDPDGTISNYSWAFGDGTNATGIVANHAYVENGIYSVTLRVTDNDGLTSTLTQSVTVLNRVPVASFTQSATTAPTGTIVSFNGTNSNDPDGFIASYFWTFGDGANATGTIVNHAYAENGIYTVTLKVIDNDGAVATSASTITITNRAPVAYFTSDAATVYTGVAVGFNASSSHDPDGWITSYFWTFGDGANATGMIVSHAYVDNGLYTVTLAVTDNDGAPASTSTAITVLNRLPVASFTESASTVYKGETIYFNASTGYDPDGTIASYFWTFGDGANATGIAVSHSYVNVGVYTVALTVTDNDGATDSETAVKTVLTRQPVASFTESATTVYTGDVIGFNASASYDPDGIIVTYSWNFGDGSNASGVLTNHAYSDDGIYTVTLTVTDNDGATDTAQATMTLLNRPPVASFTESATTVLTGQVIYFNASASYDVDGSIGSYFWTFGDGTNGTGVQVSHVYSDNGIYTVTLTITDNDGATASANATKTVLNRPPVASFSESAQTVYTGQTVTFNASSSNDPDGWIASYFWDFSDGTNATGVVTSHAYSVRGSYTVTLTVTDNDGATATSTSTITVVNQPPVASFSESATTVYKGEVIFFNASASYDPDGTIVSCFWTFGDGTNASGVSVSHSYANIGTHTVTLTVTDNDGATASETAVKTVLSRPPIASFTQSATTANTSETVYFNASSSYDPDGVIVSYFWTFGDGTNATGVTASHAYSNNGVYTIALTVTDNDGTLGTTTSTVTVLNRPPAASFTESATTVLTSEVIYFNASSSYDSDGFIVNYFWTFGDGTNATGITTSHSYTNNGVYTVTLRVTDDDGSTATTTAIKTVLNRPPVASFTQSTTVAFKGEGIRFNASTSFDPDGVIVSYFWTFGDGTNATGMVVDHAYTNVGTYTVTLTINDDDNSTASTTSSVTVQNKPPVAQFTQSATTAYTAVDINFNASGSYDLDGSIVTYFWTFGDGANASGTIVNHSYADNGVFTVTLTVTDNDGATDTKASTITVLNRAPVASFTTSATAVFTSQAASFNASASSDPDGLITSYLWMFGDGTNATGVTASHAYADNGVYTVTLTVTDNDGATSIATSTITVLNRPPVASFTESATSVLTRQSITFNATASYDPDGTIVSYSWNFGDGNLTTVAVPVITHWYTDNGTYTVTLTVTDNDGATNSSTTSVTVVNQAPTAAFNQSATTIYTNQAVTFNASASYDLDGWITAYTWNFGDGNITTVTTHVITHVYQTKGTLAVTLTVKDNDDATNSSSSTATVLNRPPLASFTRSATTVFTGELVYFNASASYDPDGTILSYLWTFGDGTNATGVNVSHAYAENAIYTVTLTVIDNDGASGTTSATETVLNRLPAASFTESASTVYTGISIQFNASLSHDPDGTIVSYFWTFGDGQNATGITVNHAYADNGIYTVTLQVTDNDGGTATATATKTVLNRAPVASFTESASTVLTGQAIFFNASASYDPDGSIVSYFWTFGDGTNATGITVSHSYADNGTYTVTFTVTDDDGAINSQSATKTVLNRPPAAIFTESAETVVVGQVIYFNASQSYDLDGSIANYFWDFGDGTNATGVTTQHAYSDNGVCTVTLTVTDNDGATASTSAIKTVAISPPVAVFTESASTVYTSEIIRFNASASYDPDGFIVSYFWTFGDGTNATGMVVDHAYAENGVYTVTLRVTDDDGATDTANASKTVLNRLPIASFTESATTVYTGETIAFNATGSYDLDGSIVSFFWTFGDGTNATGVTVTHAYTDNGLYTVTLTVMDNDGALGTATAVTTVLNRLPIVNFTESATTVLTNEAIYFNASGSYDIDGSIVSFFWTFGDGSNASGVTVSHAYADNGVYTVTLTVTDNDGATASTTATKTVLNRPPVAIFTESAEFVYIGETITFNASQSYDPDGFITSYFWTFGDGTNATGIIVTHAYNSKGVFTVTLTVTDNDGATATASAVKTVGNKAPVASFTQSAGTVLTNQVIYFDASTSFDPDGFITDYFWEFGDATNATGVTSSHSYNENGVYTVKLTVTDNDGAKSSITSTVTVLNRPPIASFIESASTVLTDENIYFNASASYDLDGVIVSYSWTFGDGATATGAIVSHSYVDNGVYTVTLTVTDNDGATASTTAIKTVLNRPPVASFTQSATTALTAETIQFNASASSDPDGSVVGYFWTFGDGTNASGVIVSHSYADNGIYTVTLTVTDNDGVTATASSAITVLNRPPVAAFTPSATQVLTGETVTFNATSSYDPDGFILDYFWTFGDGSNATGDIVQHSYAAKGVYNVLLTLTDNDGATATATTIINVENQLPTASYTYSPSFPIASQVVTFNASSSRDPDGSIVNYMWNFGDGNVTAVTIPLITHTYSVFGNYTVTLTVTDNDGGTATDIQTIRIRDYPTANFSYSPSSPIVGQTVIFNASLSTPRGGTITDYLWNFGDGTPQFSTTNPVTTHTYSAFGNYTVILTVSDSEGLSTTVTSTVRIRDYPSAAFTFSPSYPIEREAMTFDASSSAANGGTIISYRWSFGDGNITTVTTSTIVHAYSSIGNYTTTLTVTDSEGLNSTLSKIVNVRGYPVALFTFAPSAPYVGDTVTFNASLSSPNGGAITRYQWNFGDTSPLFNTTNPAATHIYGGSGNFTATLTVTDSEGLSSVILHSVVVAKAPVAAFNSSPAFPKVGERVTFDASASYDPNGYVVSYRWDFGDGNVTTISTPIISHVYTSTGVYAVALTVTDNSGYTDTRVGTVTLGTPKAAFTFTPRYPIVYQAVAFNASASYDPNGYIVSYVWNFGDSNITTVTIPIIIHNYALSGNYTVTLTVSDNEGLTDTTSQVVSIGRAPVASFVWAPVPAYIGDFVTFNGSASTPSSGSVTNYVWNFGDGSPIENKTTPATTHRYTAAGNYTVSLTIKDSVGLTNTVTRIVTISQAPVAIFIHVPVYPQAYDIITFNASGSYDPNGYIVSYVWNFGDGNITTMTAPIITHVYNVAGNYSVVLIVTDNEGFANSAFESLFVSLRPPVADFTFTPSSPIESQTVSFNATGSNDLDGTIVSYTWNFGDGNTTSTATPLITHRYSAYGSYTATLTVTDNHGLTNAKAAALTVRGYPTADFIYSPNIPSVDSTATFNASASTPNGGIIISYSWNFGDGSPLLNTTSPIATHIYTTVGQYAVTLRVTDDEGLINTKSKTITIARGPVVSFTYSPTNPYLGDTVTFDASASYDPDGSVVSYLWNFGDGSPLANLTTPMITHIYMSASNYVISLTVTDNQGISATTTRTVIVGKAPVAAFTYTPASPIAGDVIRLDASSSSGPTRSITSYRWNFGDGNITTVTSTLITHVYPVEGSYNVSLTVTDTGGYSDTISHVVNVRNYPVSSFIYSPSYPIRAQDVTFDASGSQPRGGTIVSYLWNFGDGTPLLNTTDPIATHVYATVRQYTVTLQVKDSEGLTSATTTTLKVRDYPTATFTYSPASPVATYSVTFNASLSRAGSGNITGYAWNFGDGNVTTVTAPVIFHVFSTANSYNVTMTVTNTEGLSSTTSRTLVVLNALPIASFNYSPSFPIVNQTATFDASASHDPDGPSISYRWNFGDGNITTTATAIIYHVYRISSSFTVTLTVTDNVGQTASQAKTVKVGQPPTASFTYSPSAPYVGDGVTFDASQSRDPNGNIVTYSWSFGDGFVINVTNPVLTHTYSAGGNYTVVLTVVDNEGLPSTTSKLVPVAKAPVAIFTFSPDYPIAGEIITFNASQSYDARRPIVKYMWAFGGGVYANTTIPTVTYYYPKEGNYTVTLTVFDNAGYTDTVAHLIRVRNYPTASFTISLSSPIKSQATTFDALSSLPRGGTITSYLWDFGDGTPPVQTSTRTVVHTYATYGNFTVNLTVADSESLTGSTTKTITVRDYPAASFTVTFPIQRGVPATFDATASTPNGGIIASYKWDFGDGNITTVSYPVIKHSYTSLGIFTIKLTVTDNEALSNLAAKSVTVVPAPPIASFTYTPLVPIIGQTVTFNASASYDPDGWIASYNWNFGDGATLSTSNPITTHVYNNVGPYNVTLRVQDYDSYSNSVTKLIEVLAYPNVSFAWSPLNPLVSTSAVFNASASTPGSGIIASYAWNFGDGNVTTMTTATILHAYGAYGSYTVTLTVTNSKGLSSSLAKSLTVYQTPLADFGWQPIIPKAGETVTFNASGSSARGGVITTYRWEFNDGTPPVIVVYRSTVTHTFAAFGQFVATLTVTDSEGLTNSKSKTILIVAPPTASFSWSSYPKAHEPITFNGSSSTANGGVIVNYRWDFGDGNITNVANPITIHTYLASGNFNVNLTVTDSEGLSGTAALTVNVAAADAPNAAFVFFPSSPYVFQTVNFDASASTPGTGTTLSYEWDFGDGNTTSTAVPTIVHVYKTSGNFTISATVRNIAGLSDTTSKSVTVLPISGPKADFSWSPSVPLPNRTVTFDGSASIPGWNGSIRPPIVTWRWDFGDGNITQVSTATIVHVFTTPNDFMVTLTVTDINGSTGSTTKTVKVSTLIGDLNGDGTVDIKDLAIAAKAYGSSPGMPNWNPVADMNGDLKIDIKDLSIIALNYGETSMSLFIPFTRSTSYAVPYWSIVTMCLFAAFFTLIGKTRPKRKGLACFGRCPSIR